jgi:hypothetical protein
MLRWQYGQGSMTQSPMPHQRSLEAAGSLAACRLDPLMPAICKQHNFDDRLLEHVSVVVMTCLAAVYFMLTALPCALCL